VVRDDILSLCPSWPHRGLDSGFLDVLFSARSMSFAQHDHSFTGFDRAVVVDVETTGFGPMYDRVLRIACLRGSLADFATKGFTILTSSEPT
jgi:hypothetical protein